MQGGMIEFVLPIATVAAASPLKVTAGSIGIDSTRAVRPIRASYEFVGHNTSTYTTAQLTLIDPAADTSEAGWGQGQPVLTGATGKATATVFNPSRDFRYYASTDNVIFIRYSSTFDGNNSPPGILRIWFQYQTNVIG